MQHGVISVGQLRQAGVGRGGVRRPTERLVVETDSHHWHRGSVAFEDDHARDLDLRRRGYAVRRFTEDQARKDAAEVAADLRDALRLSS